MKAIKSILKKFDVFGVPFSFRYKNQEKYNTSLGGFFFFIFCIIALTVGIYYFIPFISRKHYSLVYYSMTLPTAETIKLKESKAAFAVGFDCKVAADGTKVEDILQLKLNYFIYRKYSNGTRKKFPQTLSSHKCTYKDFYNQYNFTFDLLNLKTFECLDNTDHIIKGIYTDEFFSYYEFSVSSKEDSEVNFNRIDKYLMENDCKISVYYTDITFDLNDYKDPIKPLINELFIQLNPILFLKMNAYFMNQYFTDDDYLIFNFDESRPIKRTMYSEKELYYLYKGLNRFASKLPEYQYYMKIYIRADIKKTEIKRRYQKLLEYFADSYSILMGFFKAIFFIITFFNDFYAKHSISKKLFLFKEVKSHNFDFSLKNKQIRNLIVLTDPFKDILLPLTPRTNKSFYTQPNKKKIQNDEIKTVNTNNNDYLDNNFEKKKSQLNHIRNKKEGFGYKEQTELQSISSTKDEILNVPRLNTKPITKGYKIEDFGKDKKKKKLKIEYTFNIFEIIFNSFFYWCLNKNLKLKRDLNLKANSLLNYKFDIVHYARNMILLDIMTKTLLEQDKKNIINFLRQPILYTKMKVGNENDGLYNSYSENDFDNLFNEITELTGKSKKLKIEKKLIFLSNQKLKELI